LYLIHPLNSAHEHPSTAAAALPPRQGHSRDPEVNGDVCAGEEVISIVGMSFAGGHEAMG